MPPDDVLQRELAYHEELYSGFAQSHFAKPAVRALRRHMVARIVTKLGLGKGSSVLSVGCGIGDTELVLAPHVGMVTGVDLSPKAIRQARADSTHAGVTNAVFHEGALEQAPLAPASFDAVIAIFFLHHLPEGGLDAAARAVHLLLKPGGGFYSLDPNRYRLSGFLGELLFPKLMERYQSPDEKPLDIRVARESFERAGFAAREDIYDFASSPAAGLFPGSAALYQTLRAVDAALIRLPLLRRLGSNAELIARKA